jgi:hypothetical protein
MANTRHYILIKLSNILQNKHSFFPKFLSIFYLIGDSGTHINVWELKSLQMLKHKKKKDGNKY